MILGVWGETKLAAVSYIRLITRRALVRFSFGSLFFFFSSFFFKFKTCGLCTHARMHARTRDKIILYYTRIKIKARFGFFTNLSLMTNTATLNTPNTNTINYAGKREREGQRQRQREPACRYKFCLSVLFES